MLPEPLHPAIVHFPIVLALLVPLVIAGAWLAIGRRNVAPLRAWSIVVLFAAGAAGAGWVAVKTGEAQEETVERVLASEAPLHAHEEAAERFLFLAVVTLGFAPLGYFRGRAGDIGRGVTTAVALAAAIAVVPAGHSGGELVYRHGAARSWTDARPAQHTAVVPADTEARRRPER